MAEKETNVFKDNDIAFADFAIESGSRFGSDILRAVKEFQVGSGATSFNANESGIWLGAKRFSDAPFSVDMAGNTKITGLVVTGGTINFGKTSITDTAHAGYYIGNTGIFMGNAGDTKSIKYDISAGTFVLKGITLSWGDVSGSGKPADNATVGATLGVNVAGGGSGANQISNSGYVTTINGNSITTGTITVGSSSVGLTVNSGGDIVMNSVNGSSFSSIIFRNGSAGWDMSYVGSGGSGYNPGELLFEPMANGQNFSIGSFALTTVGVYTGLRVYGDVSFSGTLDVSGLTCHAITPGSNGSYDIGSYSNAFRNIYITGGLEFNGGSNFIAFYGGLFQLNASISSTGDIYAGSDSGSLVAGASGYVAARGKYFIPVAGAYSSTKYYLREA